MAFFSESGLVASGYREKLYLCEKCGLEMVFAGNDKGYCCPKGHGCSWPMTGEQKVIREPGSAIYAGGAIEFTGSKPGGKKNKKLKKQPMIKNYLEI